MTQRQVLISGAGLAGPALAYWLHAHGLRPVVVERAPGLRDGGYKVDVRGAAVEVLKRMGLYAAARAADTGMRHITYVRGDGSPIARLDAGLLMGRRGDDIEVVRIDLTRILYDATAPYTEYLFGDSIASLHGTQVTFASGATRHFDLVVGADGLHSATRQLAFGDVRTRHLGAYIAIFEVAGNLGLDREEVFFSAPGRMVFAYSTAGASTARVGMVFASPPIGRVDPGTALRRHFAGMGWRVDEFLDRIDDPYFDALSQVELPRWSAGRVALLGDAAYCSSPASGQGTSMALTGAYVLGKALAATGDHAAAFADYERTMRPYVERNLAYGRAMAGDMVPGSRWQLGLRHYAMRTLRLNPWRRQIIERVTQPLHDAANAITL